MPKAVPRPYIVLVVEDEWLVSSVVVDDLRDRGFVVIEAGCGEDALACLAGDHAVDVVFTDIHLGNGMSGWDVAEAFRKADPGVGVIYASGQSLDSRRDVPGSLFFRKPYSPLAVSDACTRMARERRR